MDRPKLEVADVFRRYGDTYRQQHGASMSVAQWRVMNAIEVCRTAALGGHLERCDQCGYERNAFNSCRDRHCPKCQGLARAQWIEERQSELLETGYFHVVFTVPEEIASITYQNKDVVYGILFQATAETLKTIAADPKHLGVEMANAGSLVGPASSCQFGFCPVYSVASSWNPCKRHSIPANYSSSTLWNPFATGTPSLSLWND